MTAGASSASPAATVLTASASLSFFIVVAPITNALWLFGSIALAVSLKRAARVPRWVYLGLPVAWIACIPLGSIGGALLAGAYWLGVGHLLAEDSIETDRTEPAPVTA